MFAKSMIAATALAATLIAAAPMEQAAAKTNVDINVNLGSGGWNGGYGGYYGYGYPYYRHRTYTPAITCGEGSRMLSYKGYRAIEPVDCSLPRYRYMAWKNHRQYLLVVNRFGDIVDREPIYY